MRIQRVLVVLLALGSGHAIVAQSTNPPAKELSHVERFSTPEVRAERSEADAAAKLAVNPNDDLALNARALARMRLGRYEEAQADLRRVVSLKPANAEYQVNLGYVLWKLGRADEAVAAERAALKLDPQNATAHYQLGRFLLRLGEHKDLNEAISELRRALELDPRQYEVRFELIAAYRELGDLAQAAAQLDVLQESRPTDPRVFYVTGLLDADRKDLNSAVRNFNEAIKRDPTLYGAWQDLGVAYVKAGHWNDAVRVFADLSQRQPNSVEAAYFHALSLYNSGNIALAETEARRALRIDAGAVEAHTLLGIILAARGNANAEAADALSQAIALNPASFDAHFYLGRVLYVMKDYAGAVKALRAAMKLNPRQPEARFFLGTALESAGDSEGAMAEYQGLVASDANSAIGLLGLGALLVKRGKVDEAIDALRRAVTLDAQEFEAHWALGRALALREKYQDAVSSFQKAIAIAPNRSDAHYQLGLALKRLGRTDEANREFAIVERLNTEFRTGSVPK
ncbi:MAG: protein O-GlcNAc transferase [Blastocatellia bacterium]|jgi:tetratricopeptide (TPR) repeat protein|nr:protein O-GlcNAc transferase [Blastocatellia bacterium]